MSSFSKFSRRTPGNENWTWESREEVGNLYVAEVDSGRVQKYVPRKAANPAFLVQPGVKRIWN